LTILFHPGRCGAQVFPKEGSALYYRLVGFSFPQQKWASKYKIEIATGNYDNEQVFEKNIVTTVYCPGGKIITEVPFFGSRYTWRIVFITSDSGRTKSILYHFSTRTSPDVDTSLTRLRVIKVAEKYKDAYVFVDATRVLYDMKGEPVWFLPGSDVENRAAYPRDLKLSPAGTITFITGGRPYEIDYNGKILWHYKGDSAEELKDDLEFNHEFERLKNGHYMGLEHEDVCTLLPGFKDSMAHNARDSARFYDHKKFSRVVEYDDNYREVWSWNSSDYLKTSDLLPYQTADSLFDPNDLHQNSFYFDEARKSVYFSFRNINRVIKISYPEGTVLSTYGKKYRQGLKDMNNGWFCGQHSCRVSGEGNLYLYNNNTCDKRGIPTIVMMQQPKAGIGELKKVWEYQCPVDEALKQDDKHFNFKVGGNVLELPDRSMFISMGYPGCRLLIVTYGKKVLWSAIPEKYNTTDKQWEPPMELYRASIITDKKQLEDLIWKSEKE